MKTRNQDKRQHQSPGTLASTSQEGVSKFLKKVGSRRLKKHDDSASKGKEKQVKVDSDALVNNSSPLNSNNGSPQQDKPELEDEMAWEDGPNPNLNSENVNSDHINKNITIEFDSSPSTSAKRKPIRRASAEEKEVAELVHRTHLLCLLARGRLVDSACDDPLIQAAVLSLLPAHLLKISEVTNLTVHTLTPLVNWLHTNFHVKSSNTERFFRLGLPGVLETHEGTPEEIAALSVAMFRALNLSTRFVSILDAASLKPDADKPDDVFQVKKSYKGVFGSSTVMVTQPNEPSTSSAKPSRQKKIGKSTESQPVPEDQSNEGSKRKGDVEFEMQMQMALSATAASTSEPNVDQNVENSQPNFSPFKKLKKAESEGISTAIGSKKIGAPMYWAEVYCNGENLTGKWVHIDVVNSIINGEQKVESAAAACKTSLRYVVAFANQGAKDVTRRYCAKWYKIASQRVSPTWWDSVLHPLKELESRATKGMNAIIDNDNRNSIEDMELETKALTEPLPTNQQAYRSHHLYALERWLTKYQILHPKGPVLGFCSGHPVYPRACVQMLHTKERWLREGLQIKVNEVPVKVLKRSVKLNKGKMIGTNEDDENDAGPAGNSDLFGKWQTEPLCLPHAENGIVPKNERGQVDVWSEKCLPPGTVHLGFPRIFTIAKKLKIDFAPAMVGFEFRNGRSFPLYNGIVVCTEYKDTILRAYAEEEVRRGAEERKKNELQALSRWYQLLSSIVTRQRIENRYAEPTNDFQKTSENIIQEPISCQENEDVSGFDDVLYKDHEHVFLTNDKSLNVGSSIRTKRCRCGFSIEVEEL